MKGITKQRKDGRLDSVAAQTILERYIFKKSLEETDSLL
jgi:RNase H-fold protein (predicted Holliday junction resolvase)